LNRKREEERTNWNKKKTKKLEIKSQGCERESTIEERGRKRRGRRREGKR